MKTWQCLLLGWLCAKVIRFAGVVTWSVEWWFWVGVCTVVFGLTLCAVDGWRAYRKSQNESQSPATRN
jgi:hypothetical protein